MVKDELGSDAVILHTKRYQQGGFLGYNSKEVVEVTAAVDDTPRRPRTGAAARTRRTAAGSASAKQPARQKAPAPPRTVLAQYKTAGTEKGVSLARLAEQTAKEQRTPQQPEREIFVPLEPEPILHAPAQPKLRPVETSRAEQPQREAARPNAQESFRRPEEAGYPPRDRIEPKAYIPQTAMDPEMYAEPILRRPIPTQEPPRQEPRVIRPQPARTTAAPQAASRAPLPPMEDRGPMMVQRSQQQMRQEVLRATETEPVLTARPEEQRVLKATSHTVPPAAEQPQHAAAMPDAAHQAKISALEDELAQMRQMLRQVMNQPANPEEGATLKDALRAQELREDVMQDMIRKIPPATMLMDKDSPEAVKALGDYLHSVLKTGDGIGLKDGRPKIVALIGTTGVGKTTTIAKIAAKFVLERGISVALITADTYRISAVDQLKTYSDIIGLPLEIVYSPAELRPALRKHRGKKLILIDTAGRSQNNEYQMNELKEFLAADPSIEKHLVLSATTKERDAEAILERFSACRPDRILLTKTDETESIGFIVNLLFDRRLALSYFTNGQSVPDDIEPAKPEALAKLMLG